MLLVAIYMVIVHFSFKFFKLPNKAGWKSFDVD